MHILSQVSRNNSQRQQIILLSIITGIAIMGCGALYLQYRRSNKAYITATVNNVNNKRKIQQRDIQIKELQNKIDHLIADKESNLHNHNPDIHTV